MVGSFLKKMREKCQKKENFWKVLFFWFLLPLLGQLLILIIIYKSFPQNSESIVKKVFNKAYLLNIAIFFTFYFYRFAIKITICASNGLQFFIVLILLCASTPFVYIAQVILSILVISLVSLGKSGEGLIVYLIPICIITSFLFFSLIGSTCKKLNGIKND